jgi:ABC-type transporter Mla subunit MlaD
MIRPTMASGGTNRNTVLAGGFVVAALLLSLAVFLLLQKLNFEPMNTYRLRFSLQNGVTGLSTGSEVRVGGLKRGTVTAIMPVTDNGVLRRIDVDFELDAVIGLYANAEAVRVAPIVGNTSWINITSVGSPTVTDANGTVRQVAPILPGGEFDAVEAPGLLANIVGSQSAERIIGIIDRTYQFSEVLAEIPADYRTRIIPAVDAAAETVRALRDDYQVWRGKVTATLDSAEAAAQNLEDGSAKAVTLLSDAQATLAENRPKIGSALTNLDEATGTAKVVVERVRDESLPLLNKALSEGERTIGELADLLDKADAEFAARLPDVRQILADLRTAAGQVKLATIEIRRSPWRLLYRPSTDVLAHEQLYEATRNFVEATGQVRAASASLDELLRQRPDLFDRDPALQDRLKRSLIDAVAGYEEAQRRLYGILLEEK